MIPDDKNKNTSATNDLEIFIFTNAFYPYGDPKADDGQPRLDNEENSYDTRLRLVDIAVNKLEDDGSDEGKDVGGDDDGAAKEQVVGGTVVALLLVGETEGKHHASDHQLDEALPS